MLCLPLLTPLVALRVLFSPTKCPKYHNAISQVARDKSVFDSQRKFKSCSQSLSGTENSSMELTVI